MSDKIKIGLTVKEYKLLMSILNDAYDERSSMSCNDPYEAEKKIFNKKERIEIVNTLRDWDDEGFLFNFEYVDYLIERLKKEKKKN